MSKKIISEILIPVFLMQVIRCYSVVEIPKNEIAKHDGDNKIIILKDSNKIKFEFAKERRCRMSNVCY